MYRGRCVYHDFNPLPPCGGRLRGTETTAGGHRFQSTPSVWRETHGLFRSMSSCPISIHSLRVEGDSQHATYKRQSDISIHSLRVEGDGGRVVFFGWLRHFNPLPPCGGRLATFADPLRRGAISIHSLRVEGDSNCTLAGLLKSRFQSTPSVWRETQHAAHFRPNRFRFQSTPSVWRETPTAVCAMVLTAHFNPLPPCGGRLMLQIFLSVCFHFNPLPPCGGRQRHAGLLFDGKGFQSTPSVWRETHLTHWRKCAIIFQSTPSVWRETPAIYPV